MNCDQGQLSKAEETRHRLSHLCKVEDCLLNALSCAKGLKCEGRLASVLSEVLDDYRDELAALTADIQLGPEKEKGTA